MSSLNAARVRIIKFLRLKGRSLSDAEDLFQEACLRLHEYSRKGIDVRNPEAYIKKVVQHLAIDEHRAAQRRPSVDMTAEEIEKRLQIETPGVQPDEVLDIEQRLENVRKRLDAESPRMRQVYFAHRAGYSYKHIAAEFKISESTVEKQIAAAVVIIMEIIMEMKDEQ